MNKPQIYSNAHEWRAEAMQRESMIDTEEQQHRKQLADTHNLTKNIHDPDFLADQQLYILGKMDLKEYQRYLLFKHSKP